jgi:hypothetical protein
MLSTLEVVIYAAALLVLLPLLLYELLARPGVPESSWLAKYYRAERYLNLAADLFLLAIGATAVAKLGLHFGYIDASVSDRLMFATGLAFGVTILAFLGLFIRAALKVHRRSGTHS